MQLNPKELSPEEVLNMSEESGRQLQAEDTKKDSPLNPNDGKKSQLRRKPEESLENSTTTRLITAKFLKKEQAAILVKLIKNKEQVYDIYKEEQLNNNLLSKQLFFEGVPVKDLTHNTPMFGHGLKEGKIRFFPSTHTSEIFISCLEENSEQTTYISSMKGIGKTFGLALFVLLLRCDPTKRVLYIHNPQKFIANPYICLQKDLETGFSEEFKDSDKLKGMLESLRHADTNRLAILENLLSLLIPVLSNQEIDTYFVIDGFNIVSNYLKDPDKDKEFPAVYRLIVDNADAKRIILMVSATNEEYSSVTDKTPGYQFEPLDKFPQDMMDKFITFMLGDVYELDADTIAKIREITGDNLRQIDFITDIRDKSSDLLKKQANLDDIKAMLKETAQNQMEKFLKEKECESRSKQMTKFLIAYAKGRTDKSTINEINKQHIDRRYIYLGKKVRLLFPGVEDALRDLLFNPEELARLIHTAKDDASFRGKVLEYAILGYYARLPSERKQRYDLTAIFNPEKDPKTLDFKLKQIKLSKFEDNAFEEIGLYLPDRFTFPVFDAFCKGDSDNAMLGIQIKLHVEKKHVAFYEESLKDYPGPNAPVFGSTSKKAMVRRVLNRAAGRKEKLITVFISTESDLKRKIFKDLKSHPDERLRFYHLSAEAILSDIGLTKNSITTLLNGS